MTGGNGIGEALSAAIDALEAAGVESPRLDAELLLAEATGLDRAALIAHPETPLEGPAARRFAETVRRRLRREPVAYILGRRWFRNLELRCDRRALIPRPETELLVEVALELGDGIAARRDEGKAPQGETGGAQGREGEGAPGRVVSVLDVGTGTGAIALAIADERPGWRVTATDTSPEALSLARENAEACGLAGRVEFIQGTLPPQAGTAAVTVAGDSHAASPEAAPFDVIAANLPYIRDADWPTLPPEIRDFEPRSALTAGEDGLDAIRALIAAVADRWGASPTEPGGAHTAAGWPEGGGLLPAIALELAPNQAEITSNLLREAGWRSTETRPDLAGHPRVVLARP